MKHALLVASLVLVAGSTAACGDDGDSSTADDGAPTNASTADFCGVFEDFYEVVGGLGAEAENSELISALKDTGEDLEQVGTPEDIPEEARAGFELTVETIQDLDAEASQEDLDNLEEDFSEEEKAQSKAFDDYLAETCAEPSGDEPTEESSE